MKTNNIETMIQQLNDARTTENGTDVEKRVADINAAIQAWNIKNLSERIEAILSLESDRVSMFREFINNPMVDAIRLKQNKEGEYSLAVGQKQIGFMVIEKAYQAACGTKHADGSVEADTSKTLAKSNKYYAMLTYFVDNLTRAIAGDLSEQVKKVKVPNMTDGSETERKEYDFSGVSINALEMQLNTLVAEILPAGLVVKMKRVDVKALKQAATTEKLMKFTMSNEIRMLNKIFSAIRIRMNDEAYILDSKAKAHKHVISERTEKQEEVMSKVPERHEAAATLSKNDKTAA